MRIWWLRLVSFFRPWPDVTRHSRSRAIREMLEKSND
jgi:hypothetical protein